MRIDLIDLIVGSAVLLFGLFLYFWLRSPALRERIEQPKHVFLAQAQHHDRDTHPPAPHVITHGSQQS
jgi:hypothetical protein